MTLQEFTKEFAPVIQVFGADAYPKLVIERMHYRTRDMTHDQIRELVCTIIDTCKFAPKVPDVVELSNIIRARHRQGIREEQLQDDVPRTPEVAEAALATITEIFSRIGK